MKIFSRLLFVVLPLAASVHAEVPVYRNQQLDVSANADGSFTLFDAKRRNLADVDSATVRVDASVAQAEVAAKGILSIACVALEEPAVVREGKTFYVVLAETTMAPDAVCMALVAYMPFDAEVSLDLRGLEPGEYVVNVNGVERTFLLENALPQPRGVRRQRCRRQSKSPWKGTSPCPVSSWSRQACRAPATRFM